jgi:hypothetical protein
VNARQDFPYRVGAARVRFDPPVGLPMATLPVAILVLFFQRYFVQGMVLSGLKG